VTPGQPIRRRLSGQPGTATLQEPTTSPRNYERLGTSTLRQEYEPDGWGDRDGASRRDSRPIGDIPCDYAFRPTPHTLRTRRGEKYETLGLDTAGEAENGEAGTTHFIPASSR
jgi:hypothetical protein